MSQQQQSILLSAKSSNKCFLVLIFGNYKIYLCLSKLNISEILLCLLTFLNHITRARLLHTSSKVITRKSQAMAMPPLELTQVREYSKRMTMNIMILVFWSIIWLLLTTDKHLFSHVHSMPSYVIYFWCYYTNLLCFPTYLIILVYVPITQIVLSSYVNFYLHLDFQV